MVVKNKLAYICNAVSLFYELSPGTLLRRQQWGYSVSGERENKSFSKLTTL